MTCLHRVLQGLFVAALAATVGLLMTPSASAEKKPPRLATQGPKPNPVPPVESADLEKSIARGVEFLVERQNPDGSWGSARRTKGLNIFAPVPGSHDAFRTGTSSLCIAALIEVGSEDPEVLDAISEGEAWLMKNLPDLRRAGPEAIYNNWGHAYSIQALTRMYNRKPDDKPRREKIRAMIESQVDKLVRYECVDGGWCYYDFEAHTQRPSGSTISFVTATVLVALDEARQLGVEVPEKMTNRAKASILRQRNPDYSYCYGEYLKYSPRYDINRPGGSLGRSQACNLAMRLWGDETVNDKVLNTWLDRLFARNLWLDIGRKRPVPHESWFAVAGYFFYYGHYYGSLCIEQLPPKERGPHQDQMATLIMALQEKDGSWWDYPLYDYHQPYGTGFALMTLVRCRRGE